MTSSAPLRLSATALFLVTTGCAALGSAWNYIITERPPYPLRAIDLSSDARIDSTGVIIGTFVGTGSDERVTLLSSDTGFISALAWAYRVDLRGDRDLWSALARRGTIPIPVDRDRWNGRGAEVGDARVASPYGHSFVGLESIRLRGSSCGWRGARAEITVSGPLRGSRAPSLRGPVVGSFRSGESSDASAWRDEAPRPSPALETALIERTERDMDSVLAARLPRSLQPLARRSGQRLSLDPTADVDAAEVVALWAGDGRVRYAVALRVLRETTRGNTLLASTVMIWDEAGAWRQMVFAPAVTWFRRGQLEPHPDAPNPPVYWSRLDAVSGFGLDRDYLIVEQMDVDAYSVIWGAIEGRSNSIVAAAEVGGACADDYSDDRGRGWGRDRRRPDRGN
jgi:hypothetical protein